MRIMDIPFDKLLLRVDTSNMTLKEKRDYVKTDKYKDGCSIFVKKNYKEILAHSIPYLAQIPVPNNKPGQCLQRLKVTESVDVFGERYPGKQLLAMIKYLTYVNRSELSKGSMTDTENRRYGSLTPLLMFALREHKKIPYEYWDKTDPDIAYFLSSNRLYKELIEDKDKIPRQSAEHIIRDRNYYISQGAKGVNTFRVTGFNDYANISGCGDFVRSMIYQTWLASEDNRDIDTMILDPYNWDNIPSLWAEGSTERNIPTIIHEDNGDLDF